MSPELVSIIIPVLNDSMVLKKTLAALNQQTYGREHLHIIVVDNGSTDDCVNIANELADQVVLLPQPQNPYVARNVGLKSAKSDVIGLLDARCIPDLNFVEEMMALLTSQEVHLAAGNIKFYGIERGIGFLIDAMVFVTVEECVKAKEGVPTGALMFRRNLLETIGYFREDWRSAADTEWSMRVWQKGLKIGFAKKAIVQYGARSFYRLLVKGRRDGKGHFQLNRYTRNLSKFRWTLNSILRMRPASKRYIKYCLNQRLGMANSKYSTFRLSIAIWIYRIAHSIGRLGL